MNTKWGYLLLIVGFLAASLFTVLDERAVEWSYFIPAFAVGVIGVAVVRASLRRETQSEGVLTTNVQIIKQSLSRLSDSITRLNSEKSSIVIYELRHRIDELLPDDLNTFVEARESIGHRYGLQNYADIMSHFAAGERYINRVWSASADGYRDEADAFLDKAEEQFNTALSMLSRLMEENQ